MNINTQGWRCFRLVLGCLCLMLYVVNAIAARVGETAVLEKIDYHLVDTGHGRLSLYFDKAVKTEIREKNRQLLVAVDNAVSGSNIDTVLNLADFNTVLESVEVEPSEIRGQQLDIVLKTNSGFRFEMQHQEDVVVIDLYRLNRMQLLEQKQLLVNENDKISLTLQNANVSDVVRALTLMTGKNVVLSEEISGITSVQFHDVAWSRAFNAVLQANNLIEQQIEGVMWVFPVDKEESELYAEVSPIKDDIPVLETEYVIVKHAKAVDVAQTLSALYSSSESVYIANLADDETGDKSIPFYREERTSGQGYIGVDERTNAVIIRDSRRSIRALQKIIKQLDVPVAQVEIETRLVQINEGLGKDIGVRLGFALGNVQNSSGSRLYVGQSGRVEASRTVQQGVAEGSAIERGDEFLSVDLPANVVAGSVPASYGVSLLGAGADWLAALDLELSAIEVEGRGKVLASPKILTLDKQRATIEQGQERLAVINAEEEPRSETQKAVLSLSVEPHISPGKWIELDVDISNDAFVDAVAGIVSTNRVQTQVRLQDGQTMVIGGIFTESEALSQSKVPFFGDIPYLGRLFRRNAAVYERSEMLIFLTPRIVYAANRE